MQSGAQWQRGKYANRKSSAVLALNVIETSSLWLQTLFSLGIRIYFFLFLECFELAADVCEFMFEVYNLIVYIIKFLLSFLQLK